MHKKYSSFPAFVLAAMLVAGVSTAASAAVVSYNSLGAFNTAVGSTISENFNSISSDISFISPSSATVGIMTFSSGSGANGINSNKIDANPSQFSGLYSNGTTYALGDIVNGGANVRIDFSSGLQAWGGDFLDIADSGRVARIDIFDIANLLLGSIIVPAAGDGNFRFIGFELTGGDIVNHIVFSNIGTAGNDVWGLDDVVYKPAQDINETPAPDTLLLLSLGILTLIWVRRQKA